MSFTHTNAPARTSAAQISVPTPLPPPVTSARRPVRSISMLTRSDFHDDRDHRRPATRALVDESRQRFAAVAPHRVEVGGAFDRGRRDRVAYDLLRVLEEALRLGGVDPAVRHDLGAGDDLARGRGNGDDDHDDA